jgi:trehalose 6-phosphate phosphatase
MMAKLLVAHLDSLAKKVRTSTQVLLFADFDGTLVPIQEEPTKCFLSPAVSRTLSALAGCDRVAVGLVSGRSLEDLRTRVGLAGIAYAGNHGLEIEGPGFCFREPSAAQMTEELDKLVSDLRPAITEIPGAWIEHKGLSVSIHYRETPPANVPRLIDVVRRGAAPSHDTHKTVLRHGKMVLEVRPAVDWHKGKAIHWLANRLSAPGVEPMLIYLGDDDTDEDAFAALPDEVTILVGENRRTSATYYVRDPKEVQQFLDWLLGMIADGQTDE